MRFEELTIQDPESDLVARIAPQRGALVTSLCIGGRELLFMDRATFGDPTKNVRGGIPVLFPSPGKLDGDRWSFAGRSGALKQHGFARTLPWTVRDCARSTATLELTDDAETRASFPWRFATQLKFTVRDAVLRIGAVVRNLDSTPMPFAFGLHPYFRVEDKSNVVIPNTATSAFDNITKLVDAVAPLRFDATEVDMHLLDHGGDEIELQQPHGGTIWLRASPEFWLWVIWTLPGQPFVCLEPWTARANALNHHERLLVIEAGASKELWVEIGARR